MAIRQLPPGEWGSYFDTYSSGLVQGMRVDYAQIRVLSPEIGDQPETGWLPLHGITYDRKGDLLEVDVDGLGHLIYHPKRIYVDEDRHGLLRFEVVREDGTDDLVEVR